VILTAITSLRQQYRELRDIFFRLHELGVYWPSGSGCGASYQGECLASRFRHAGEQNQRTQELSHFHHGHSTDEYSSIFSLKESRFSKADGVSRHEIPSPLDYNLLCGDE
jgi:hypothetical protein